MTIPAKKLSTVEVNKYSKIMCEGNKVLQDISEKLGMTSKDFRKKMFKQNPIAADSIKLSKPLQKELLKAIPYIQKVRDIEWDMLCGYIRLVNKLSYRARDIFRIDVKDCQQTALMALLDCIYGYTKEDIAFVTYAYNSIKNRLLNIRLENNLMSNLSNRAVKLLGKFDKLKQEKMVAGFRYDDETIISFMDDLTEKDIKVLKSALLSLSTVHASVLSSDDDEQSEDFTSLRKDINNSPDTEINYIKMAYRETNLTALEREIVDTYLCPYYGWQTDLARKSINPVTRKPYSNRGIAFLLEQALNKIRHTYVSKYGEVTIAA